MPAQRFDQADEVTTQKNVLIVYPGRGLSGGVTELYNIAGLESDHIRYFSLAGALRGKLNLLDTLLMYFRFTGCVRKYDLIHINPSLMKKSFFRDGLLVIISRLFHKKVLVYWHGWIDDIEHKTKNNFVYSWLFKASFKKADASVVLGSVFREKLGAMGYRNPVYLETNCADDRFLKNESSEAWSGSLHKPIALLFLSRMEKTKGVYIAIEALRILNESSPDRYELLIAGDGIEFANVKEYLELNSIPDVKLLGRVDGPKKHEILKITDILIFPTYYDEGMPLVILESMTYGIPVITRPVGGIPDVVQDKKNGFISESRDPQVFAGLISDLCKEPETYKLIYNMNKESARAFSPESFRERMKGIYNSL
ncbi:MAG: glycosyltransferase [Bacteroidota bacterium]|nr:glycosyltransferase [Bacteroidota bacterium]MDP4214216.1 glycosyltransferase [Bacteroidota bacterium]MDP4251150.1 glycosyltransferase [Bacteroidota bacterium]